MNNFDIAIIKLRNYNPSKGHVTEFIINLILMTTVISTESVSQILYFSVP